MGGPADAANVLRSATANAGAMEQANQQARAADPNARESSWTDVWTHTGAGVEQRLTDPASQGNRDAALVAGVTGDWSRSSADAVGSSVEAQASSALRQFQLLTGMREAAPGEAAPQGVLANIGATFGLLTSLEQMISAPLAMIPFPAFPAIRVLDMDVGLPHAHSHPPNLIPPAPPVPLPSTGPIIPIPFLSGASKVLINGMPAARCGDMGLGIWCGGYFPMYEVFLGSSSVWIEGARAGRLLVDITKHCTFSSPKPSDPPMGPMVGMTISSSGNVIVGGVPMPSLLNLALGKVFKALFKGMGRAVRALRSARAARAAARAGSAADDAAMGVQRAGASAGAHMALRPSAQNYWRRFLDMCGGDLATAIRRRAAARRLVDDLMRNGSLRVGGDDAFQRLAMEDLYHMASTRTGRESLERIGASNHRVDIHPLNESPHGTEIGAHCQPHSNSSRYNFDHPDGARAGDGSNSSVYYDPTGSSAPGTTPDATLNHEVGHAANNATGNNMNHVPDGTKGNLEEANVLNNTDNPYRAENGLPQRQSWYDLP